MLEGSILKKLDAAHRQDSVPLNLGVYYKNTLVALCHALEDFILESDSKPLMVTAFQRGKWYLQEAERYGELASKSGQIAILASPDAGFATHPTSQKDNVAVVSLPTDDPVAQEWHLIIFSSTYTAMVLCQELSSEDYGIDGQPKEDLERKFYGFWTFEPELVQETVKLAIEHISKYDLNLAKTLSVQAKQISAEFGSQQKDDLTAVVSKVVSYLQEEEEHLHQPEKEASFAWLQSLEDNLASNKIQAFLRIAQLLDHADLRNPLAATEVAAMVETMGQILDLPSWQVKRLRLAGLLHRLASLNVALDTEERKSPVQKQALEHKDYLPQASILRIMPQLEAIAKIITHQTEAWDGSGTPSSLAYDAIPLESRIIRLLADFQKRVNQYKQQKSLDNAFMQALADCQNKAGTIYDPKLVDSLTLMVIGMQQGMSIQAYTPKIATGMWLLDAEFGGENTATST
ncbi:MAG: DICT sensory domain-containing protein [Xenococcaceae cyanobacterium]